VASRPPKRCTFAESTPILTFPLQGGRNGALCCANELFGLTECHEGLTEVMT